MQGQNGSFRGVSVPRFASWLSYDGTSGLVMRDLDVETLGGSARLAIDVPPTATKRPVSIRGRMEQADGEGVLRMLFGWGELGIGTAATGELDVSWPKGKTRLSQRQPGRRPAAPRGRTLRLRRALRLARARTASSATTASSSTGRASARA